MDATFEITSWDEQPVVEWDEGKVTHAEITKTYSGDIEGDAVLEYVLAYRADGTAAFVGVERITGTAAGHEGGLVLRQVGEFADGAATAALKVVGGSGDFTGASGDGELVADPSGRVTLTLSAAS